MIPLAELTSGTIKEVDILRQIALKRKNEGLKNCIKILL